MPTERRIERMKAVLANKQPDLTVVCENIHDPHNVSAILRSCDAVGIEKVRLLYTNRIFPKLGKKSSASAKKWLEIEKFSDAATLKNSLKASGFKIYATHLTVNSRSIYEIDWTDPAAIIVGNEHEGVTDNLLEIADEVLHVPMMGMIQSLNVSVATAVILYEACRQRLLKAHYPNPALAPEAILQKLAAWKEK